MNFDINKHTIYYTLHGSHAYGLNTPTSDVDYKGVAIPPREYFISFLNKFEQAEKYENRGHDKDEVIYDIRKFLFLASNCNPNIIEVLFVDDGSISKITPAGQKLRDSRDLFISARVHYTFGGYAHSQLKRIKTHRRWLLSPPKGMPSRSEFNLPEDKKLVNKQDMGAFDELQEKGYSFDKNLVGIIQREKAYKNAVMEWKQYQNWIKNRNPDRAKMEKESGFDRKHAMHLVRLMRMSKEILSGQGVIVKRPDREELLSVRNGSWTYDEVVEHADKLESESRALFDKLKEQDAKDRAIPLKPNVKKIDKLCQEIIWEAIK